MNTSILIGAGLLLLALLAGIGMGRWLGRSEGATALAEACRSREAALGEARTQLALVRQGAEHARTLEEAALREAGELKAQLEDRARLQADLLTMRVQWSEREGVLASLRQEAAGLRDRLETARQQLQEQAARLGEGERLMQERSELRQDRARLEDEIGRLRQGLVEARGRVVELETAAAKDREALAAERQQLDESRAVFRQEFENLAHRIFESSHAAFDARSREGLAGLLVPFKEQLESFRARVDQVHTENAQGHASLRGELERLRALNQQITEEASSLARALKGDKKAQGNWGEQKVELLLEQAGLRRGIEYGREQTFKDEEGRNARPDFVVNLPEGKHIIIDSKVSLVDFAASVAAETVEERTRFLAAHVAALRNHVRTLGDRRYPELLGMASPDFTFLFVAIEPAYLAAVEHSPGLFQEAYDRRIVLVTATTLLPVLRVVANLWSLQRQNQSTQALAEQAGRVYEKLRVFVDKMERLGGQMETAQNTYREAFSTLKDGRGSLARTVDRFVELGVKVTRRLPATVGGGALAELETAGEPPVQAEA